METVLENALKSLTTSVNLSTGISNSFDNNRAKETFKILHEHGHILLKSEIAAWARQNRWSAADADELGSLAQQIGEGKKVRIVGGSCWADDIYERWSGKIADQESQDETC